MNQSAVASKDIVEFECFVLLQTDCFKWRDYLLFMQWNNNVPLAKCVGRDCSR